MIVFHLSTATFVDDNITVDKAISGLNSLLGYNQLIASDAGAGVGYEEKSERDNWS